MRSIQLLSAVLLASQVLCAQPVTLTYDNYGRFQAGDMARITYLNDAMIGTPARGADVVWDYSTVQVFSTAVFTYEQPSNPTFPTASVARPVSYTLASYELSVTQYDEYNQQGHFSLGDQYEETTVDVTAIDGTLHIPAQSNAQQRTEMLFPATFGSSWSSSPVRYVVDARITGLLFNNTPSQLVQNYTATDTIIGWGRLLLPGSISLDVLLKKQVVVQVDSFYINGIAAPKFVLDQIGLQQNDSTRYEYYTFHAPNLKGEAMVLASISSRGSTEQYAYYNTDAPTSVAETAGERRVHIAPDPAPDGQTVLSFTKTGTAPWTVAITDRLGREVAKHSVAPQGDIRLPLHMEHAAAGMYLYTILDERGNRIESGSFRIVR